MKDLLVFTHPRTGSSALAKLLNRHPDIALLSEPCHPEEPPGIYGSIGMSRDEALADFELFHTRMRHGVPAAARNINAIKHMEEHLPRVLNECTDLDFPF